MVVPYRSHEMVWILVQDYGFRPDVLCVLVPGVLVGKFLEVHPEFNPEDTPHVLSKPSHLVPVSPEGETDYVLRKGDVIFLSKDTPEFMVVAAASLAADIDPGSFCLVDGSTITTIAR